MKTPEEKSFDRACSRARGMLKRLAEGETDREFAFKTFAAVERAESLANKCPNSEAANGVADVLRRRIAPALEEGRAARQAYRAEELARLKRELREERADAAMLGVYR